MANSRSARKRIRANERKHLRNRAVRSAVRTKVGKARRSLVGLDDTIDSQAQLTVAVSALDRAAAKGILHPNNASRRKARLMHLAHALEVAAAEGDEALATARAAALGGEKGRKTSGRARPAHAAAPAAAAPAAETAAPAEKTPKAPRARAAGAKAAAAPTAPAPTSRRRTKG